jgi:hypothetical protein
MPTPGLTIAISKIRKPAKTSEEQFHRFYNEEHVPAILDFGIIKLALRFKNADPTSTRQYLAIYPLEDTTYQRSPEAEKFIQDTKKSKILACDDIYEYIDFDIRRYEKIQTYEGHSHAARSGLERARTIVMVAMEPAPGQDQDFEQWYRKQHLDMMSMLKHYRRSTRYKRQDGVAPRYLALHEFDCRPDDLPKEQLKLMVETEWAQKILKETLAFETDIWELVNVQGDEEVNL